MKGKYLRCMLNLNGMGKRCNHRAIFYRAISLPYDIEDVNHKKLYPYSLRCSKHMVESFTHPMTKEIPLEIYVKVANDKI